MKMSYVYVYDDQRGIIYKNKIMEKPQRLMKG